MKLLGKQLDRELKGSITLLPEQAEDMWHTYNLIAKGDCLRTTTIRRVQSESATGSTDSSRVRTTVTIEVEQIEFDQDHCKMRINGRNREENQFIKMGAYHTVDLELNRKFTVIKDEWDIISLDRVEIATNPSKTADVAAVVMQEGLANICLITGHMTHVKAKIEVSVPRKRKGSTQHEKGLTKFFEYIVRAILQHIDFDIVKAVILASPGFLKDQFHEYLVSYAVRSQTKALLDNKAKFILCHSSSGHKYSLKEVLSDPSLTTRLQDTKAAADTKVLQQFFQILSSEPDRAFYGYNHVEAANDKLAIDSLLITDALFRSNDIETRKKYVKLVEEVKNNRGNVYIFSSLHVSGEQLTQLSGVAAILRFPLPEIEDEVMETDSDSD
eukprot:Nk52_evm26s1737 gene=Nk52_evmTU26s1737